MNIAANIATALVALLHLWFLSWRCSSGHTLRPAGLRPDAGIRRGVQDPRGEPGPVQRFSRGRARLGLLLGAEGNAIKVFFLVCVIIAGVFGATTASRTILFVQALPGAVALALLCWPEAGTSATPRHLERASMSPLRLFTLTALAVIAFAANAVLCRLAFTSTQIDPASFTAIRLASGTLALWLVVRRRGPGTGMGLRSGGTWRSALALFAFAVAHTFGYVSVPAGAGTLLFCGAVQASMIFAALWAGERLGLRQSGGLALALAGLVLLVLPGLSAPPPGGSALMLAAGAAWGVYSLLGRGAADPAAATAGNFLRATWLALALGLVSLPWARLDAAGVAYAVFTGIVFTGLGYGHLVRGPAFLSATRAATVQLSTPVIAALGAVVLLHEPITLRLVVASAAVLGGSAMVILRRIADQEQ